MNSLQSRGWCFTLNNYTKKELDQINEFLNKVADYGIIGFECGKEGTKHIQGYVYIRNKATFKVIKESIPRAHIEKAKGNPEQNKKYCSKEGDFREYGSFPKQGKRSDLNKVRESIKAGANLAQIHEESTNMAQIRFAESYIKYVELPRNFKPKVIWIWGPSGSGKSRWASENYPNAWWSGKNLKWWQGYDAHETVVLDDFRADFCTFHELLRILDRYPYTIECKGGSRQLLAKTIIITCIYHPSKVYKTREDLKQLIRRIDEIKLMDYPEVIQKSNCDTSSESE